MKIKRNISRKFKILYIIIAILVLAGAGYGIYLFNMSRNTPEDKDTSSEINKVDSSPPTDEQIDAGTETKRQTVEEEVTKPDGTNQATPPIAVTITSANQNGATVAIRSLITGSLDANAACSLTITNGSASTTKSAPVQPLASSATCQGFDVSVGELGAGAWSIQLTVTSSTQSVAASTSLVVK